GVMKAYTTRVGGGPFPTELLDATGDHIRNEGKEFGTVTGRPRRCGWLDLVAVRHPSLLHRVGGVAGVWLRLLRKLAALHICTHSDRAGVRTDEFPVVLDRLADCRPVYRTIPGWRSDLRDCRSKADLPKEARAMLDLVGEHLEVPVRLCSVGPARDASIFLD